MPDLVLQGRYYQYHTHNSVTEALELDTAHTALLLVDVYGAGYDDDYVPDPALQGFYQPNPAIGEIIRDKIKPVKDAARIIGLPTVYLTNYLSPGLDEGNEWRNMSIRTCGIDVLEEWKPPTPVLEHSKVIAPDEQDVLVPKQMYSGFFETNLESVLRNRGIRNLVVVGFDSRICLGTTVTDAMYRNFRVVALRDCIRTSEFPETEEGGWANFMAIRHIEGNVGYTTTSDDFLEACAALR